MLTEVTRDVLHLHPQRTELLNLRQVGIDAEFAQVPSQRVLRILPFEGAHHLGERVDHLRRAAKHLPHLARRAAATIGDDVGRHRRATIAIARVEILDRLLATVAARQVQVDVGPLAAFLREEALEQQFHAHRIHRGDAQAVADGAVGRRPAPLREDVLLPAEVHEVPDDQEVPGEIELLDQIEFACDLPARPVGQRPVTPVCTSLGDPPQEGDLRLAVGNRIIRKPVAQVREREVEALGQRTCVGECLRQIAEERLHLLRGLQVAFGVGRQAASRVFQCGAVPDAGEDVVERPCLWCGETHAVSGEDRHPVRLGSRHEDAVVHFLVAREVPLDLHMHLRTAEHADDLIEQASHAMTVGREHRTAHHGDQPLYLSVKIAHRQRALPLRRRQLHPRDQPAQRSVALR